MNPSPQPGEIGLAAGAAIAGKYRIARALGRGGMSIVLEADHIQLGHKVAIKLLKGRAAASPNAFERLLSEARAAAQLKSEHAVRVFDMGALDDGTPFIVMEHLAGVDLRRRLARSGPMAPAAAIDLVLQACDALAEAHARGIVHRDLKPANIFLARRADGSEHVKLLDFGLASLEGDETRGGARGSPGYAAPEQLRGHRVDARADVWALGVLLYELVSGRQPFAAGTLSETLAATLSSPAPPLTSPHGPLPAGLAEAIDRCLRVDPALRFADVGELADALAPLATEGSAAYARRISDALRGLRAAADPGATKSGLWSFHGAPGTSEETGTIAPSTHEEAPIALPLGSKADALVVAEVVPPRRWGVAAAAAAVAIVLAACFALWIELRRPRERADVAIASPSAVATPAADAGPPATQTTRVEIFASASSVPASAPAPSTLATSSPARASPSAAPHPPVSRRPGAGARPNPLTYR